MLTDRNRREMLRDALRDARLSAGLRQLDVTERLGKPQSFVAKVESGERKIDMIDVLNICAVVQLSPHDLVDRLT